MTSTTLTEIPFHNQTILAQQDTTGKVHVALKPLCENMGISYGSQYNRLQKAKWATVFMMKTVGADGKSRDMTAIDRRTFSMWLATIDTARVKNEDAKNLIVAYQCEAADALDAYFFGDAQKSSADKETMHMLTEANTALVAANEALRETVRVLADVNKTPASQRKPSDATVVDDGSRTPAERWYLQQINERGYAVPKDCPFDDEPVAHKRMIAKFGLVSKTKRIPREGHDRKKVERVLLPTDLTPDF